MSTHLPYKVGDIFNLTLTFLLLLSLPIVLYVTLQPQDIRQQAAEEQRFSAITPTPTFSPY